MDPGHAWAEHDEYMWAEYEYAAMYAKKDWWHEPHLHEFDLDEDIR